MNAENWLHIATADLPSAVKIRIAQDTREHLADAGLGSAADVDPVLGAPEDTAKELKRLYLTDGELDILQDNRFLIFMTSFSIFMGMIGLFLVLNSADALAFNLQYISTFPEGDFSISNYVYNILEGSVFLFLNAFLIFKLHFESKKRREKYISLSFPNVLLAYIPSIFYGEGKFSVGDAIVSLFYLGAAFAFFHYWRQHHRRLLRTLRLMA
ncbi:MAG: hypothetical protein Q4C89_08565 [Deinococcus sp.]|uniref:hypothetical protein n=1 Tax=Deinococcus sp. TaxID=47478 RepID=UPI0026DBBB2C|nr:hypothetical protein [Deinococcus sp.]MDO4246060.1 hypothetical protein [Deinococcus sp.]